ncbi:DUF2066 domain-containing protein [Lysobacter niastensis]|nr:DUF2066 domain-containing protein [Lysobacter niastensis]
MVRANRVATLRWKFRALGIAFAMSMLLLASFTAAAQRVEGDRAKAEGLYAAEISVNGQGEPERNTAFARGLAQVLGKLTGDRGAASKPGVGQELRRAKDYVADYDYRQDEGVSAQGAPTFGTTLIVRFDEERVNELAAILGLPVWPQPRPKPVLWLAIDDGSGPRLVGLKQVNAARPALNRAIDRGYRLGLPNGTAAEQAAVGAIWRGDTAAVARASSAYSPPMQLVGKLYRSATGWTADWIFVDSGKVLSKWSGSDADARKLMATGADGAADALIKRYAKRGTSLGLPGTYRVIFTGMASSEDFIRLAGYLQKQQVVRKLTPVRATPEGMEFDLELLTGPEGLRRALLRDDVLSGGEGEPPVYRLN